LTNHKREIPDKVSVTQDQPLKKTNANAGLLTHDTCSDLNRGLFTVRQVTSDSQVLPCPNCHCQTLLSNGPRNARGLTYSMPYPHFQNVETLGSMTETSFYKQSLRASVSFAAFSRPALPCLEICFFFFSLPQPDNENVVDGCQVVHVSDTTDDLHHVLKALFDRR
jgi:hypothetical protein